MKIKFLLGLIFSTFILQAQEPPQGVFEVDNLQVNQILPGRPADSVVVIGADKIQRYVPRSEFSGGGGGTQDLQSVLTQGAIYSGNDNLSISNTNGSYTSQLQSNPDDGFSATYITPTGNGLIGVVGKPFIQSVNNTDSSILKVSYSDPRPLFEHNGNSTQLALLTDLPTTTGITSDGVQVSDGASNPIIGIQQASPTQRGTANLYTGTGSSTTGGVDQNTFTNITNAKVGQDNAPIKAIASGTNTYTITLNPAPVSYSDGAKFFVKFPSANTGASTLNINGLGAKNITVGGQSLSLGIIDINVWYMLIYNVTTDTFRLTTSNKVNTQSLGDSTLNIANTAFVNNAIGALNLNILYTKTDAVPSSPVNNTTSNTIVKSYDISAGTIKTGVINVKAQFERTAVGGALNWRVYLNTSNTLTGATLFSTTSLATNSTTKVSNYERNAYVNVSSPTAATITIFSTTQSGGVLNTTNLDPETLNINPSVVIYIIFAIELNNAITENARVAATDISIKKSN